MEWIETLSSDQVFTIILAVCSALLGGTVSLATSLVVFYVSRRNERLRAEEQLRARRDQHARMGLAKLVGISNQLFSFDQALSSQFEEANRNGAIVLEPGLAIRTMISGSKSVEKLSADELEFLFFTKSGGLVTEIQLLQQRVETNFEMLARFNKEREEFAELLLSGRVQLHEDSDAAVRAELEGDQAQIAEVKLASLNRLIADMVVAAPKLLSESLGTLERYRSVAEGYFGEKFPKVAPTGEDNADP